LNLLIVLQLFEVVESVESAESDCGKVGMSCEGKVVATPSGQSWAPALFMQAYRTF
jgi:hypothetical protein